MTSAAASTKAEAAVASARSDVLEIRGLVKAYPGERAVLSGVDLTAGPGVTVVMGASGSGKSTLLRCVAGVQRPDAGSIVLDGGPVQWSARTSGDCRIGLVFQDYRLIDFLTVQENIRLARELRRLPRDAALESTLLEQVGLGGMGPRTTRTLSGGQQQRLAIARTLAARPRLILADEPTGALDRANSDVVARLLHDVAEQAQLPVLIATHDSVLAATAQQTYVFDDAGALHRAACAGSPA